MQDNEIEEGGISIGDIFRTIFSQKWLALILVIAITVIGTVGLYLLGRNDKEYVSTFNLGLPGSDDNPASYTYPDGTLFHYTDLMSTATLNKVKASNPDFADIDVEKIVEDGGISIVREMVPIAEGATNYTPKYTLRIKAGYFKSEQTARNFFRALTEFPLQHISEMNINYDSYLTASASALTFDTQLSYLQYQLNYLSGLYNTFIGSYNGSFVVKDGYTLNYYKSQLDVFIANNRIHQLQNEALKNGYIKSEASLYEYESLKFEYERQRQVEEKVYEELVELLTTAGSTAIFDNPQIIEEQRTIQNIILKLEDLNRYINSTSVNEAFNNSVAEVEAQIRKFTDDFAEIADIVYDSASTVSFTSANILEVEGGRGLVMSAVLSLVVGIIVAAIVAYIVGWSKSRKKLSVTAPAAVYFPAQAQIAATSDEEEHSENTENKE